MISPSGPGSYSNIADLNAELIQINSELSMYYSKIYSYGVVSWANKVIAKLSKQILNSENMSKADPDLLLRTSELLEKWEKQFVKRFPVLEAERHLGLKITHKKAKVNHIIKERNLAISQPRQIPALPLGILCKMLKETDSRESIAALRYVSNNPKFQAESILSLLENSEEPMSISAIVHLLNARPALKEIVQSLAVWLELYEEPDLEKLFIFLTELPHLISLYLKFDRVIYTKFDRQLNFTAFPSNIQVLHIFGGYRGFAVPANLKELIVEHCDAESINFDAGHPEKITFIESLPPPRDSHNYGKSKVSITIIHSTRFKYAKFLWDDVIDRGMFNSLKIKLPDIETKSDAVKRFADRLPKGKTVTLIYDKNVDDKIITKSLVVEGKKMQIN